MSLKIAVTSPFGWPYVRRGNRFVHELAAYLADQGHEVHLITSKPGNINRKSMRRKVLEKHLRLFSHPLVTLFKIDMWETFFPGCFRSLLTENYDIVQTFWQPDGFAASLYRSLKGIPFVHLLVEVNHFFQPTTFGRPMLKRILKKASRLQVPSLYLNEELKAHFKLEGEFIPMPVDMDQFTPRSNKPLDPPRILCTSSFLEARKRVYLLVQAFELLLKEMPNAVLQLSSHGGRNKEVTRRLLKSVKPDTRRAIEILDVEKLEDMPELYRQAALTVLPSLQESFGMVIIESLASGTPFVGTRSGAIPEIINDPRVGVLIEPTDDPKDLSEALVKGFELAVDSHTPLRCRQHVAKYSWQELGPRYEALYMEVLNQRQR